MRQVDTAWIVIDHFRRQTDKGLEEEKAKIMALEAFKDLRYDGSQYF
ncbi:MAG: hypothetical protein JXK94_11285 [Deltaproteobacteria bacterium]|nr:hypothetical protein [Deltaproteobacteria bacterium]